MTTMFAYRAVDHRGDLQRGVLAGDDPDAVAERVRRMGLRPVTVTRQRLGFAGRELSVPGFGGKRIDALAVFSRQFATMIASGTPILRCLTVLAEQTEHAGFADALRLVRGDVENGDQLSDALARQPAWFDDFYVSMVQAGEGSGSLAKVLDRLADATEARARLRRKVKSAMAYPTAVAVLILLCVAAMLMFLIPTFEGIFADLEGTLPLPTQIVLGVSGVLTDWFPLVALAVAVAVWRLRVYRKSPAGRLRWDTWKLRIPVFGKLATHTALARFSRSLSVLVSTGVPAVEALGIAGDTADNRHLASAVEDIARRVRAGASLSSALVEHPVFTEMVVQMVQVGEESGALDEMLVKVAELYDAQVNSTVESLTSLLEPLLIVAMGLTVGGILMSVYLPMFEAISLVR